MGQDAGIIADFRNLSSGDFHAVIGMGVMSLMGRAKFACGRNGAFLNRSARKSIAGRHDITKAAD
jgi:hypothetical protein